LSALYIAVSRSPLDLLIYGTDEESTEFLINSTHALSNERRFPAGTQSLHQPGLAMHMLTQAPVKRRFGRMAAEAAAVLLSIDMLETPSGMYSSVPEAASVGHGSQLALPEDDRINRLAACDGIVFFIDPTQEQTKAGAYEYLTGALLRMAQRQLMLSPGPKLPQHIAVCVTKFDDPEIYRVARLRGFRTYDENDPFLFPRVHSDDAEIFFRELSTRSGSESNDLIADTIRSYFHEDRIRYFITSSIGFYLGKGGRFRDDDPQNCTHDSRIRGPVHPINVVEPLVWLGNSLAGGAR